MQTAVRSSGQLPGAIQMRARRGAEGGRGHLLVVFRFCFGFNLHMGKLTKHVSLFYVVASFSVSCLAAHVGQRFSRGQEEVEGGMLSHSSWPGCVCFCGMSHSRGGERSHCVLIQFEQREFWLHGTHTHSHTETDSSNTVSRVAKNILPARLMFSLN